MRLIIEILVVVVVVLLLSPWLFGCSTTEAQSATQRLTWTVPDEDAKPNCEAGPPVAYDFRYSADSITESNWDDAIQVQGEPTPAACGTTDTLWVSGLEPSTWYYYAMKAIDECGNISLISNVPHLETEDTRPPAVVTNLGE